MKFVPNKFIRQKLFGISSDEVKFTRRGFRQKKHQTVEHLETIGVEFLRGYHLAIHTDDIQQLVKNLNESQKLYRGFAFEGAAMGLALLDHLTPWRKKLLPEFLNDEGEKHIYMAYVGIGWALARIPWLRKNFVKNISEYDSILKWLILDGFGFHEGYFNPDVYFKQGLNLEWLAGYAPNAFAQGLGRSLWFVEGADIQAITETISRMPRKFHADLWSGIGLACAYAGGANENDVRELKLLSNSFLSNVQQGVVFASASRYRAENLVEHTEMTSQIICERSASDSASVAFSTLENLPKNDDLRKPSYEIWRRKIRHSFSLKISETVKLSINK